MFFLKFLLFLFVTILCTLVVEGTDLKEKSSSPLLDALRSKRSPVPDPHHHHHHHAKIHAHIHYSEPYYHVKPLVVPVVKPVVIAKPVYSPVVVAKPVLGGGCLSCGGGGGGAYSGSHASSQASSHSFSAGLHSPFGGLGFSSSSAQSSAHSGAVGFGK